MSGLTPALTYVVVQVQIEGNLDDWHTAYYSDNVRSTTRKGAIRHGFNTLGHDDWLIGVLRGDILTHSAWQFEDRGDDDECADMAAQLGWLTA